MDHTVLGIGAHPDDCDLKTGGVAAMYADAGATVRFVSVTNGAAGHHEIGGVELARRRRREAAAAAEAVGIEYEVWDHRDGELEPTLPVRKQVIRLLRRVDPDLVLTHRPNDYHPDHRAASRLVRDAAYMVRVPNVCTDVEPLDTDPVIAYLSDGFEKPAPFEPDVVVDIDDAVEAKLDMLACHESQVYEWLPYTEDRLEEVPPPGERREWLRQWVEGLRDDVAERYRDELVECYGADGADVTHAEAFEGCEYGAPLTQERAAELFPF